MTFFEQSIEPRLGIGRERASVSMAVLAQLITAAIAMLIGFLVFREHAWGAEEVLQATLSLVLIVLVFNRFLPFVFFSRTSGKWLIPWVWLLRVLIYGMMPATLALGFLRSVTTLTKEHSEQAPETQAEAVDALIEAGQEEGILDESNRDLIQSVVEFGEKTVRDAMKPRPEIVAVPPTPRSSNSSNCFAPSLFRGFRCSREPFTTWWESFTPRMFCSSLTPRPAPEPWIRSCARTFCFVPESKLGSDLLREMQKHNIRMAIVVDEYGGVAGLVTIEDLVEEIVGEIGDEHEKTQIVRDSDHSYIVPGNMDVDRLDELFGVRLEGRESSTVAGLVSELAGRIPAKGEVIEEDGLRFEVLDSTDRRVERVRISASQPKQMKLM